MCKGDSPSDEGDQQRKRAAPPVRSKPGSAIWADNEKGCPHSVMGKKGQDQFRRWQKTMWEVESKKT